MNVEHFFRICFIYTVLWTYTAPVIQACTGVSSVRRTKHRPDEALLMDRDAVINFTATSMRNSPYPGAVNYTRYAVARSAMFPLRNVTPIVPDSLVVNDVTTFRYPITITPLKRRNKRRNIFIAVISATDNFEKRAIIRKTWAKNLKNILSPTLTDFEGFAFILGRSENSLIEKEIVEESKTYGDIIQIDMPDFYRNLPLKDAGLINWLRKNVLNGDDLGGYGFILMVDDDVYVNVRSLEHFIHYNNGAQSQSIFGTIFAKRESLPIRAPGTRYDISFEEWPWNDYPQYLSGPAIILSKNAIVPLLAAMQTTPMMPFEDVYLSGICAEKANVSLISPSNPIRVLAHWKPADCQIRRTVAWMTDDLVGSHTETENFYRNTNRRCVIIDHNGINREVTHDSDPLVPPYI